MPVVEVGEFLGLKKCSRGWLRQVRWAYRPKVDEPGEEKFIECTVLISGCIMTMEPHQIEHVIDIPQTHFWLHIITRGLFNPPWKRRRFDPREFLEKVRSRKETDRE